jgi:hypothetical protein
MKLLSLFNRQSNPGLNIYYTVFGRKELSFPVLPPWPAQLPHFVFFVPLQNAVRNWYYELSNHFDNFFQGRICLKTTLPQKRSPLHLLRWKFIKIGPQG